MVTVVWITNSDPDAVKNCISVYITSVYFCVQSRVYLLCALSTLVIRVVPTPIITLKHRCMRVFISEARKDEKANFSAWRQRVTSTGCVL